jgi:hypothetical protein
VRTRPVSLPCIVRQETGRLLLASAIGLHPAVASPAIGLLPGPPVPRPGPGTAHRWSSRSARTSRPAVAGCARLRVRGPGLLLFPQQLGEARPANPGVGITDGARSRAHARCGPTGTGTAPEEAS